MAEYSEMISEESLKEEIFLSKYVQFIKINLQV